MAGTPPETLTGSWRRIVPPAAPGLGLVKSGTTLGRWTGAETPFTRNATLPKVMTSFSAATASVTRDPFRNVPFEEPTSRSEEHTSELQSQSNLVCRLLLEKKKTSKRKHRTTKHTQR